MEERQHLRQRRRRRESQIAAEQDQQFWNDHQHQGGGGDAAPSRQPAALLAAKNNRQPVATFHVAKWAILRLLGLVYLFAFLGAYYQNDGLMGERGLEPASLKYVESNDYDSPIRGFLRHPTIFWWIPLTDATLAHLSRGGIVLSLVVAVAGINSWLLQLLLWFLYLSIVTVAQLSNTFYSYGWESQLLETGFLAVFLCRLPSIGTTTDGGGKFGVHFALFERFCDPPSAVVRWLFCWLIFRISLGAGLIKVRGSSCWRDKTCLYYHFETQPVPSPLSFVFHFLPRDLQRQMVDVDLWVQLYTIALVLVPVELVALLLSLSSSSLPLPSSVARWMLRAGGFLQVGFMVGILLSGNFAFLNHLTIIPGLACLDDGCFPRWLVANVVGTSPSPVPDDGAASTPPTGHRPSRSLLDAALLAFISCLSWPVIANLLQLKGSRQVMNASFDPFRIVNTYGAFGSVGEARYEAILQVHNGTGWTELDFPCKPGNVRRWPCFCAPYHYRLDWNVWFLGFKPHRGMLRQRESWMFSLAQKLLQSSIEPGEPRPWLDLLDSRSSDLLRTNFYDRGSAPSMVKVDMYRYEMNKPLWALGRDYWNGRELVWWKRRFEESLIPPVVLDASGTRLKLAPTD
jgi:hypothetical protein